MIGAPDRTVALVTGAAQGIGLGIARSLAAASYRVVLADVERRPGPAIGRRTGAAGFEAVGERPRRHPGRRLGARRSGVRSPVGGARRPGQLRGDQPAGDGRVDRRGPLGADPGDQPQGGWLGIKAAMPSLRSRRGTIVNIGSVRATRPMPGLFSYVVSKAGLWGLTQQVAVECLNDGVTCNMVAPGWVDTPNERRIQARHGRPDFPAGIRNLTTPEEIGAAVVYLASEPAARSTA